MTSHSTETQVPVAHRVTRALLRAIWLGLIPVLLAGLSMRYALPGVIESDSAPSHWVDKLALQSPALLFATLWVIFALLLNYWRFYLPGGRHLSKLPQAWKAKVPTSRLSRFERLGEHLALADSPATISRLSAPERDELAKARSELEDDFSRGDLGRVTDGVASLERTLAPLYRRRRLVQDAGLVLGIVAAIALALYLRRNTFEAHRVLSASMMPTLQPQETVILDRFEYKNGNQPHRGDLIVFENRYSDEHDRTVKRIIGIPGDRIQIVAGHPIINDWVVPSCQAGLYTYLDALGSAPSLLMFVEFLEDRTYLTLEQLNLPSRLTPYTVPPGEYYVLGDNRGYSNDSRSWNDGRGGTVAFDWIAGSIRWRLGRRRLDGSAEWHPFRGLGLDFQLEGMDRRQLEAGIANCLKNRPNDTRPPISPEIAPEARRNEP